MYIYIYIYIFGFVCLGTSPTVLLYCSGGEGTPPETLKCLTPNPYS